MISPRPSMLSRIFADLIANSRRTGQIKRAGLAGGAQLAVVVRDGVITATVKRRGVQVGANELATFRRHCGIPGDAETLTPPEQGTRIVNVVHDRRDGCVDVEEQTWRYVTLRWAESPVPA